MFIPATSSLYKNLPNTAAVGADYLFWWPHWMTIRDCLMGEIMVKARGETYLPKPQSQSADEYKAYLTRATFYNATFRTLAGLTGAVHSRPPMIENLPAAVSLSNVTSDGQSFDMFMKKITREVISMGRYGVMIDAPPGGGEAYFVGYQTEDILDIGTTRVGSRERLEYVVLREFSQIRRPFNRVSTLPKEALRVLLIDEDDGIYKQRFYPDGNLESEDFVEVIPMMQGRPMREIPFICVGPYDFGYDIEKPPMLDLALLNLSHYRSYAELEAGRFYTATPIYSVFLSGGGDDEAEFKIGPNTVWQLGAQDKADILEFSGAGLRYLETALQTKEHQIAALGGKLSGQPGGVAAESADAVIARERGEASFLGAVISTMSELGGRLLSALCEWRGYSANVTVVYNSEATDVLLDAREIRAMSALFETGLLPLETIYTIFRQTNIIPRGVSFEEFKAMLPSVSPKVAAKVVEAEEKAKIEQRYGSPEPAAPAPNPAP